MARRIGATATQLPLVVCLLVLGAGCDGDVETTPRDGEPAADDSSTPAGDEDGGTDPGDAMVPDADPPEDGSTDEGETFVEGLPFWEAIETGGMRELGHEPAALPEGEREPSGALTLTPVTNEAGLGSSIGAGNQHGVGVAFADLDGDGWPDIFVANGHSNVSDAQADSQLWRNRGDGTFEDVTDESGVGDILGGIDTYSAAVGDYDADGDLDLYVGAQDHDVLLQNQGDGRFVDATDEANAGGPASRPELVSNGKSKIAAFGDFDGDGWLDIVSSSSTLGEPGAYLLRNRGDGTFEDITERSGVEMHPSGNPCAVMWTDYDTDGDQDLWIWNDRGGHILLRNENGERFTDVTDEADDVDINNPMGIDGADIDHDLDLDYYISNIGDHPLLRNEGDGTFTNITREAGTRAEYGWGLGFEDFDLDGWADLFLAQEDNRPFLLFHNRGEDPVRFDESEVSHIPVNDGREAHNVAVAFADYDRDGDMDVVAAGTDGRPLMLYRNDTDRGSHRWLAVRIREVPRRGGTGGISARVVVKTGDLIQFDDITGGSSRASQNELSARFGLGNWTGAEWVAVLWPDGRQYLVRGVEGNQELELPVR